jgi:hypothetical protein
MDTPRGAPPEGRLNELADYRKITGTAMFERRKLQVVLGPEARKNYRCTEEGKDAYDHLSNSGIGSLGFRWIIRYLEDRLSELDYRKIHGHCNVYV